MPLNIGFSQTREQLFAVQYTTLNEARKEYHVHIKGVSTILKERKLWFVKNSRTGAKINLRCDAKDGEVVKYLDSSINKHCCHFHILHRQPDFKMQRPSLEESVLASGHIFDLYPKFHCETNWIERFVVPTIVAGDTSRHILPLVLPSSPKKDTALLLTNPASKNATPLGSLLPGSNSSLDLSDPFAAQDILYTIVVRHPETGTGYPVAYMYTTSHAMDPIKTFLNFVKTDLGATSLEKITIDVSSAEHAAINEVYPSVSVQWCLFHVARA
ncbi:hypothetical protein MUCCIDRAFT_84864 [Mucor lusitanicus CBS 277.49]|uniref:Uncharacterized protein n=1 Tax=Mucor lusitanicus CBS 277.49 TaxID=747725 RepID=A0A168JC02_MUCCL|nr:hypothetical protein MUCCIDRAFT_84864 [Mucor lusitanicus CBS 277.49]